MRSSTKRFLTLLGSLALLVATIVVYASLLSPSYASVNELRGDLASKQDAVEQQTQIVAQVKDLLAKYQSVAGFQKSIDPALPGEVGYAALVKQLGNLASFSKVSLDGATVSLLPLKQAAGGAAAKSVPVVGTVELTLAVSGSYENLKGFLATLETNIRIMDVTRVSVSTAGAKGTSYTVVLNTYYQKL